MPAGDFWHGFGVTVLPHRLCREPRESAPTGAAPTGPAHLLPEVQGAFELSHPQHIFNGLN